MPKLASAPVLLVAATLALAACGGGGGGGSSQATTSGGGGGGGGATTPAGGGGGGGGGGASSTVKISASPSQLAYQEKSVSTKAGNVTVSFDNPDSAIGHDVCVEDSSGKTLGCTSIVTGSSTSKAFSNLTAGSYTFYCSVDSHRQAGMEGTLKIQ
jgi:plastocyanin